jgi:hypothetical protein
VPNFIGYSSNMKQVYVTTKNRVHYQGQQVLYNVKASISALLHGMRRALLCFHVSQVFRPPCFRDTRDGSNMKIQSIGGMMLTAVEWTRRGKQKRTSWRSLGTSTQNSALADIGEQSQK